jgi:hypothetical protein
MLNNWCSKSIQTIWVVPLESCELCAFMEYSSIMMWGVWGHVILTARTVLQELHENAGILGDSRILACGCGRGHENPLLGSNSRLRAWDSRFFLPWHHYFLHYFQHIYWPFLCDNKLSRGRVRYHSEALIYARLMRYVAYKCDVF